MSEFEAEFGDEEEIEIEAIGVEVDSQPIELYKVLKIADAVSGGGEAKYAITEGYVAVNGEVEVRKRRKLYDGDLIEFNQEFYVLICDAPVTEKPVEAPEPKPNKAKKEKGNKQAEKPKSSKSNNKGKPTNKPEPIDEAKDTESKPGGRGAIKFF